MACGAAAGAIVAGMIVRAGQRHDRIEQASFLQAEENGIGAKLGAEAALAELVIGLAGIFFAIGVAEFRFLTAASFEYAKHVPRLRGLPAKKRIELRKYAFGARFFWRGLGRNLYRLWIA